MHFIRGHMHGGAKKYYTIEDRRRIEELVKTDMSFARIAEVIGKSKNGVGTEVRRNGGRLNYSADKAQQRSNEVLENRKKSNREYMLNLFKADPSKKTPSNQEIFQRLEVLEMQMSILIEQFTKEV